MIYQRTNPQGLDAAIVPFQNHLNTKLAFSNWDSFDRAYLNEKNPTGLVPEYYDSNEEYQEALYRDADANGNLVYISSFFFRSSKVEKVETGYECDVALIVQCDLPSLFPSITHRADEELARMFELASDNYTLDDDFALIDVEYQINNVYREFDKKQVQFDGISNRHVVRFNYRVRYTLKCA